MPELDTCVIAQFRLEFESKVFGGFSCHHVVVPVMFAGDEPDPGHETSKTVDCRN